MRDQRQATIEMNPAPEIDLKVQSNPILETFLKSRERMGDQQLRISTVEEEIGGSQTSMKALKYEREDWIQVRRMMKPNLLDQFI